MVKALIDTTDEMADGPGEMITALADHPHQDAVTTGQDRTLTAETGPHTTRSSESDRDLRTPMDDMVRIPTGAGVLVRMAAAVRTVTNSIFHDGTETTCPMFRFS